MQSNISKTLQYCWFGGEKPQSVLDCINNWKEKLPDYEIVEINECNKELFDVEKECRNNLWFKTCYKIDCCKSEGGNNAKGFNYNSKL